MRRHARFIPAPTKPVRAALAAAGITFDGVLRNISLEGVMLESHDLPALINAPVVAEGNFILGYEHFPFSAMILHVQYSNHGVLLGCQFLGMSKSVLQGVISAIVDGHGGGAVHITNSTLDFPIAKVIGHLGSHLQKDWDAAFRRGIRHVDLRECASIDESGQLMLATVMPFGCKIVGCSTSARWGLVEAGVSLLAELGEEPCAVTRF